MLMSSGRLVYPDSDKAPSLADIGRGLGRIMRWGGQTELPISVLSHTLTVAVLLEPKDKIHGLLHDAPEVCCGDVPSPWKTQPAKDNEHVLLERIYAEHGLTLPDEETAARVLKADLTALVAEAYVLDHGWRLIEQDVGIKVEDIPDAVALTHTHLELVPQFMHARTAEDVFIEAFTQYKEAA